MKSVNSNYPNDGAPGCSHWSNQTGSTSNETLNVEKVEQVYTSTSKDPLSEDPSTPEYAKIPHLFHEVGEQLSNTFMGKSCIIETLKTPIEINGIQCTHRSGRIYGSSKKGVQSLFEAMKDVNIEASGIYHFITEEFAKGQVVIVAAEESARLDKLGGSGVWDPFVKGNLSGQFKTAIIVDVAKIERVGGTTIPGAAAHEWLHDLTEKLGKGEGLFQGTPCTTAAEADRLVEAWVKCYKEYQAGSFTGEVKKASDYFFGTTGRYMEEWSKHQAEVISIWKQILSTSDAEAKKALENALYPAIKRMMSAQNNFLAEVPPHLIETKINHSRKAMKGFAGDLPEELDRLYGSNWFTTPTNRRLRFMRGCKTALNTTTHVLGRLAFALDLFEGVLYTPRKEGSYLEHLGTGMTVGVTKFILRSVLAPFYVYSMFESFVPSTQKVPTQGFFEEPVFIMGGLLYLEKFHQPRSEHPVTDELNRIESFVTQKGPMMFDMVFGPVFGKLFRLVDEHLIAPRIIENPDIYIPVIQDMVDQLGGSLSLSEVKDAWGSESKQAALADNLIRDAEALMRESIAKRTREAEEMQKIRDTLQNLDRYPLQLQDLSWSVFDPAYQLFVVNQALGINTRLPNLDPTPSTSETKVDAQEKLSDSETSAEIQSMPFGPSSKSLERHSEIYKQPTLIVKRSPSLPGYVRIQPPKGGIAVDIAASTSEGIGAIISVNLLELGEAFEAITQVGQLALAVAPAAIPLAFAAITVIKGIEHYARANAKDHADDLEDLHFSNKVDLSNEFTQQWSPMIEKPLGQLEASDQTDLNKAIQFFGKEISKIEKSIGELSTDKNLPLEDKMGHVNQLVSIHKDLFINRQIIVERLNLEGFYSEHEGKQPHELLALLQNSSLSENQSTIWRAISHSEHEGKQPSELQPSLEGQRSILLQLLLGRMPEDPLSMISELKTLFPDNSHILQLDYQLKNGLKIDKAQSDVNAKLETLDLQGLSRALRDVFNHLYPSTIPFVPSKTPHPEEIPTIDIVGLKQEHRDTEKDRVGFNEQFSYLNRLGFDQINLKFAIKLLGNLVKKEEKWHEREDDKKLTWETGGLLEAGAASSKKQLIQLIDDKDFYDKTQGKDFDALLTLLPEREVQKLILRSALENCLAQEMEAGSKELPGHLSVFLENYSDPILEAYAGNLEKQEQCLRIFGDQGEVSNVQDFCALLSNLREVSADQKIDDYLSQLEGSLDQILSNFFVTLHNQFVAICSEEKEAPDFEEVSSKLKELYAIDGPRFQVLYQEWIGNFLVNGQPKKAALLLSGLKEASAGDVELQRRCKELEVKVQPFIDYTEGRVSLDALTLHYKEMQEKADDDDEKLLKALYWNIFAPHAQETLNKLTQGFDLFFNTLGKDLIHQPTFIPFLRNLREEDLNHLEWFVGLQKILRGTQIVRDFDPMIITGLLAHGIYREKIQWEFLNKLIWEKNPDFTLKILQDLFQKGDWETKRNLAPLLRLGDLLLNYPDPHHPLVESARFMIQLSRFALAAEWITRVDQLSQPVFNAMEKAILELGGTPIESGYYHLVKHTITPLVTGFAAYKKKNASAMKLAGVAFVYNVASIPDYMNQARLATIQVLLNDNQLEDAQEKIDALRKRNLRADDRDLLEELQVTLYSAKAVQDSLPCGQKEAEYLKVVKTTDQWLDKPPTAESSKQSPSLSTLMQRGFALLHAKGKLIDQKTGRNDFTRKFNILLRHFQYREVVPHQLLSIYNYRLMPFSLATACHFQMAVDKSKNSPPKEDVLQLSSLFKYGMQRLGYKKIEKPQKKEAQKSASSAPPLLLPPMLKQKETWKNMVRINLGLHSFTIDYLRGEKVCLRTALLQNSDLQIDPSKYPPKSDQVFLFGWVAFLKEMLDAHENRVTTEKYRRLDQAVKHGFNPPINFLFQAMLPKTQRKEFIEILNRFSFNKLQKSQQILIFFALSDPKLRDELYNNQLNVRTLCEKIREVIGSHQQNQALVDLFKTSSLQDYDEVEALLRKGASPDQIYGRKKLVLGGTSRVHRYLLHRLAETCQWKLINLFAKYGAHFEVGNFFDMNPLEHLIARVNPKDQDLESETKKTVESLIQSGIDPTHTSSTWTSVYHGFEESNPLISVLHHSIDALFLRSPLWFIQNFNRRHSDQTSWSLHYPDPHYEGIDLLLCEDSMLENFKFYCGMSASAIAAHKGLSYLML